MSNIKLHLCVVSTKKVPSTGVDTRNAFAVDVSQSRLSNHVEILTEDENSKFSAQLELISAIVHAQNAFQYNNSHF